MSELVLGSHGRVLHHHQTPPILPSTEYRTRNQDIRDREDPVLMGVGKYPAVLVAIQEAFQSIECRLV